MDYRSSLEYLESLIDYERTPAEARTARFFNLARTENLLRRLHNPEKGLVCIHIAGTKGKGSTAAMAASILRAAGYRVGLYTSPHMVSFRERIRINDEPISESQVAALTARLQPHLEALHREEAGPPSFFEAYTAIAFLHFQEQRTDIAVLETGLGGRLDATNVVQPRVCGITTIAMDHMLELGNSLVQIAGEKVGIIKPEVPVVCAPQEPEAMEVISAVCRQEQAPLLRVGAFGEGCDISVTASPPAAAGQRISIESHKIEYHDVEVALLGEHQAWNAGVAVGMIEVLAEQGLHIKSEAIPAGLQQVRWPGRFQVIKGEPKVILDGAHDTASASALVRTVRTLFPDAGITLVLGISEDKDIEGIAAALSTIAARVVLTTAKSPRAAGLEELQRRVSSKFERADVHTAAEVEAALESARALTHKKGIILVTGSLYVVGEAMQALGISPM